MMNIITKFLGDLNFAHYKKITPEQNQGQEKKITGVRHAPSTIEQGLSEAAAGISTLSEKSLEGSTPLSQNPNDKSQGNTAVAISDVNDIFNISQNSDLSNKLLKSQYGKLSKNNIENKLLVYVDDTKKAKELTLMLQSQIKTNSSAHI